MEVVTSRQREQYFSVGHETHAPSDQIDIILHVAGEKGWNSSGERMRRGEHWRIALTGGMRLATNTTVSDLPKLALKFSRFWETDALTGGNA